jgi:hypothetical protein
MAWNGGTQHALLTYGRSSRHPVSPGANISVEFWILNHMGLIQANKANSADAKSRAADLQR